MTEVSFSNPHTWDYLLNGVGSDVIYEGSDGFYYLEGVDHVKVRLAPSAVLSFKAGAIQEDDGSSLYSAMYAPDAESNPLGAYVKSNPDCTLSIYDQFDMNGDYRSAELIPVGRDGTMSKFTKDYNILPRK